MHICLYLAIRVMYWILALVCLGHDITLWHKIVIPMCARCSIYTGVCVYVCECVCVLFVCMCVFSVCLCVYVYVVCVLYVCVCVCVCRQ